MHNVGPIVEIQYSILRQKYDVFQIDILVNNAGRSQRSWVKNTPLPVHKELFDLNVFAVMSLTLEVLPFMIERKKGHIVNTSSIAGKMGKLVLMFSQQAYLFC